MRPPERVLMSGMTDPQIVHRYLEMLGVTDAERIAPVVLGHLEAELAAAAPAIAERGRSLPGVARVLEPLAADPGILQTVLTGNLVANARVKLTAFGLEQWLDLEVGAYGSDHADRTRLVPIALERAATMRGATFGPDQVWVVGDSPGDLACARAAGVRCLLVATGRPGLAELAALEPDELLDDLADTGRVLALLRS